MIKNYKSKVNSPFRYHDISWNYQYNINTINNETIFLNGNSYLDGAVLKTWWFNSDVDSSDPNKIEFRYEFDNIQGWDESHPNDPTRFLRPDDSSVKHIIFTNTTSNIIIDKEPPTFEEDNSHYITFCPKDNIIRPCQIIFKDRIGIDIKNFSIYHGDDILYSYSRKTEKSEIDLQHISEEIIISSYSQDLFSINFELINFTDEELNENPIKIVIYDLAANKLEYILENTFKNIDIEDINALYPIDISFEVEPSNKIIEFGTEGKVKVTLFNPNEDLWMFPISFELENGSIGTIDKSTIYYDEEYGTTTFIINNINSNGFIKVNAWIDVGTYTEDSIRNTIISNTYNSEKIGPFICEDENNRKIKLKPYIPSYLKNTTISDFIIYTELYLNTMYNSLSKNTNIGVLEKIARINDFNDIMKLEKDYLNNYAFNHGSEFDVNLKTLENFNGNISSSQDARSRLISNTNINGENRTEDDIIDMVRYSLEQLPYYNQYKGTNTGIEIALRMFGFCCKLINLWSPINDEYDDEELILDDTDKLIPENEIDDLYNYFMTNRFDLNIDIDNMDIEILNDSLDILVKLINSIKPITHTLNKIKYSIPFNKNTDIAYHLDNNDSVLKNISCEIYYQIPVEIKVSIAPGFIFGRDWKLEIPLKYGNGFNTSKLFIDDKIYNDNAFNSFVSFYNLVSRSKITLSNDDYSVEIQDININPEIKYDKAIILCKNVNIDSIKGHTFTKIKFN